MGVKTRLTRSFIEEAVLAAAAPGATLPHAFSGTPVAAALAGRSRVVERFVGLARRSYGEVELRTRRLAHSGLSP